MASKTITIYLQDGDPSGIKIAEISNRVCSAYLIPRNLLKLARDQQELSRPALYVLLSRDGSESYIGESENFLNRIKTHDKDDEKEFWDCVIVFVAKDESLEKAHVGYLESIAIARAQLANKSTLHNKGGSNKNHLHRFKVDVIEEYFEDCVILIETLGFSLFEVLTADKISDRDVWFCTSKETDARAVFEGAGFTILAGSKIDPSYAESWETAFPKSLQERIDILEKSAEMINGIYTLQENVTFKSPNHAGGFATGRNVNALTTWKNSMGQTMREVL